MNITVNGDTREVAEDRLSIADLLVLSGVKQLETVSVQLNGDFVDQADYAKILVKADDEVDFLYFLGGGALR